MNAIATPNPDTDPALQKRLVDKRRRESHGWFGSRDRERVVELASTIAFLITAALIAAFADSSRSLDPALATALVATYAISARVEFDTGTGYVRPTEPILVVMLFLLPLPTVPVFVAAGVLLARVPRYLRREIEPERVIVGAGDAWHAVGPTLVLIAAGTTTPEWGEWPVYAGALAAQFVVDFVNVLRASIALGIPFRALIDELRTVYLVDLLLAPIGLLAAFACVDQQWAFLALLPLIGLIKIFARERDARIENALTLSAAYRGTAHLLGEVLSTNHEYTGSHSRSVVVIAHQVGEALELEEVTMREIEFGALLHDVGKMAIPNEILNKPAKLTDEEMELVRSHTIEGADMLDRIGGVLAEVGEVVRSHHEHWDGGGYPRGLAGEEIPIAARVISCCDAFSAMTTDRPYRAAMSLDEAIAELRANAGTQFDPAVVVALIDIIETWQTSVDVPTTDAVPV